MTPDSNYPSGFLDIIPKKLTPFLVIWWRKGEAKGGVFNFLFPG
jgi:hypothetical protein